MGQDGNRTDRPRLRSRVTVEGLDRAPHRAFLRAMGLDDAAIERPFIGVVSTAGEMTPCNTTLGHQAAAAKAGVRRAGGTPREFTTISVSDGLSMNHQGMKFSLISRELIADSIEAVVRGHCYDGLVGFGGCDKTLPGVMMGMIRCNVPSVFVYGGSALPGRWRGRDVTVLDCYEAVGAVLAGAMPLADLDEIERACLPTAGPVPGSLPPIRWRWYPRRWDWPCRAVPCCQPSTRSARRLASRRVKPSWRCYRLAVRCLATW